MNSNSIAVTEPVFDGNEWKYVKNCLDSGWVSSAGEYVELFEEKVAEYVGVRYGVATANGTAAIHTALMVAGIKPGDIVVVPTLSFVATVNPVIYCGASPVFVDSEEKTLNMDPQKAEDAIKHLIKKRQKPKAIIVTHLYGHPCDMDAIMDLAHGYGLVVIEDACESLGSKYKGKMTGAFGDFGCLSFNGNKIITTGGGGMLLINSEADSERARYLTTQARDHDIEYVHNEIGYNYRLTNMQAALGLAQMEELPFFIKEKKRIAELYIEELSDIDEVRPLMEPEWAESNYWLNLVLVVKKRFDRARFMEGMWKSGVALRPLFRPLHMQKCFRSDERRTFEKSEFLYKIGFNLPSSVSLSHEQIHRVARSLKYALA
ncbi:MAG: LegC family aminotransferase [Thermodesulfobacteriota bacterium]|nr:LegC family aminotransferase [Thermodesulfobacteriota bacterium]